eukprot:COSAG01_NODE_17406_length_1154_cov_1.370616_1_plen_72_part_00
MRTVLLIPQEAAESIRTGVQAAPWQQPTAAAAAAASASAHSQPPKPSDHARPSAGAEEPPPKRTKIVEIDI